MANYPESMQGGHAGQEPAASQPEQQNLTNNLVCVLASGEHLFEIYRRLIGRPHIALARQDKIYRNISDALGRLRSDHKYFSIIYTIYPNTNASHCIAEKKRKELVEEATKIYIYNPF